MQRIVQVSNYKIKYTLIIKQVKNVNLRIEKNGEIIVTCNPYVPIEKVDAFVMDKCKWIVERLNEITRHKQLLEDETYYLYLGKRYMIEVVESSYSGVKIEPQKLIVYKRESDDVKKILENYEREMATRLFRKMMSEVYEKMSMDYSIKLPTLKIRNMKSRWGSCMPSKNVITLNLQLIHYDTRFIEYVIIHEYAHLIQPNHSKAFYRVIEKYMPDYKKVMNDGSKLIGIMD